MKRDQAGVPSPEILDLAGVLLDQQIFCWGEDIKRPEGNLLLEYGMTRERPPAGLGTCSLYWMSPTPARRVTLWGFGWFYSAAEWGGVYIPRFRFAPTWTPLGDAPGLAWDPRQFPPLRSPCSTKERQKMGRLLHEACAWAAAYEDWVEQSCGGDWRGRCVAKWWKPQIPAGQTASEWLNLAQACDSK